MAVTRDDVVTAAVEVLDERGLAALTLRAVAGKLSVSAPTLYWHVRSKRHLLDLVAQRLLAGQFGQLPKPPFDGVDVCDWLADAMRVQRSALLAHRDAALVMFGNLPVPEVLPFVEMRLQALVAAGLPAPEALSVLLALGTFVAGDVVETQSFRARQDEDVDDTALVEELRSDRYPLLRAAHPSARDVDARFELGLGLMLDGLRHRLGAR